MDNWSKRVVVQLRWLADTISDAEKLAENEVSSIKGPLFHRTDIGTDIIIQKRIDHINSLR